jgi:hypothetical protein
VDLCSFELAGPEYNLYMETELCRDRLFKFGLCFYYSYGASLQA